VVFQERLPEFERELPIIPPVGSVIRGKRKDGTSIVGRVVTVNWNLEDEGAPFVTVTLGV
jgi:hypothetical protein